MRILKKLGAKLKAAWNNRELLLTIEYWALALMACAFSSGNHFSFIRQIGLKGI